MESTALYDTRGEWTGRYTTRRTTLASTSVDHSDLVAQEYIIEQVPDSSMDSLTAQMWNVFFNWLVKHVGITRPSITRYVQWLSSFCVARKVFPGS
jgi:hypothetical protein